MGEMGQIHVKLMKWMRLVDHTPHGRFWKYMFVAPSLTSSVSSDCFIPITNATRFVDMLAHPEHCIGACPMGKCL
jgi:hypothetical protein